MKHVLYTGLIVAGLAFVVWAGSTQGDWGVGGKLEVTGTSTLTGVTTATGGVVGDVTGDITGDVTGDITGDVTGAVVAEVAFKGNLPAITGTNGMDSRLYRNTAGDSLWMGTDADSTWTQIAP